MLIWLLISLVLLLVLFILWILFAPITVFADTALESLKVFQPLTFSAGITDRPPWIRFTFMGFPVNINQSNSKSVRHKTVRTKNSMQTHHFRLFIDCLNSIKLKVLNLNVDTGDVVLNAKAIPFFVGLNRYDSRLACTVNYLGTVYAHLEMEIRLHLIAFVFIKYQLKKIILWK